MYDAAITPAAGEVSAPPLARVNKSDAAGQPSDSPAALQVAGAGNFGVTQVGQPEGHQMAFHEVMATTHPVDVHAHFPAAEPGVQRPVPELVASQKDPMPGRSAQRTADGAFSGASRLDAPNQVKGDGGGRDAGKSGGVGRVTGNISKEEIVKGSDSRNGGDRGGQTGSVAGDGSGSGAGKGGGNGQGMQAGSSRQGAAGREQQAGLAVGDGVSAAGASAGASGRHGPAGGSAHNAPDGAPVPAGGSGDASTRAVAGGTAESPSSGPAGGSVHAPAGDPAGASGHGDVSAETPEPSALHDSSSSANPASRSRPPSSDAAASAPAHDSSSSGSARPDSPLPRTSAPFSDRSSPHPSSSYAAASDASTTMARAAASTGIPSGSKSNLSQQDTMYQEEAASLANSTSNSGLATGQYGTAGREGAGAEGSGSQGAAAGGAGSGWAGTGTSVASSRSHLSNTGGPGGAEQGGVQSTAAALDALLSSLAESSGYIGDAVVTVSPGATPAQVAAEIVDVLIPLQSSGEGAGSVTIRLEPPGLGAIRAMVQASASGLTVHFQTDNARAHELLAQLLQDIKDHLASGSSRSTTVTLSWGGATGQGTGQGTGHGTGQGASRISTEASTEAGANDMLAGVQAGNLAGTGTRGAARLVDLRI